MKKKALVCLTLLGGALFGKESCIEERVATLKSEMTTLENLDCFLKCDQSNPCNELLFAFDILYWHPKTNFTELAGERLRTNAQDYSGSHVSALDFNWDFGFKAGVGMHIGSKDWDILVEYTGVDFTHNFSTNSGPTKQLHSNFGQNILDAQLIVIDSMFGSHSIDYKTVTATLSKTFFMNQHLSITPTIGVKSSWINQYPHIVNHIISGSPVIDQHVKISEKTKGLGPLSSFGLKLENCTGWGVFGDCGLALIFTGYRGNMSVEGLENDSSYRQSNKESKHYVSPNLFINAGLSYACPVWSEKVTSLFALSYESQFYFNQSYMMETFNQSSLRIVSGGWFGRSLSVYGISLRAQVAY